MEEHLTRLAAAVQDLAAVTAEVVTARDPVKERQIRSKISALLMMLYASTMGLADQGIPASILEVNLVTQENWARILDAYWAAKGQ